MLWAWPRMAGFGKDARATRMITRLTSAIIGLLAFAGMILAGLATGNPFSVILYRAILGLGGGMVVGYIAGYITEHVVQEHFTHLVEHDLESGYSEAVARVRASQAEDAAADGDNPVSDEIVDEVNKDDASVGRQQPSAASQPIQSASEATEMQPQT